MKLNKFEKDRIEYKAAKDGTPKTIYKTISAYSNTEGGLIVLGITQKDNKLIEHGVKNPQQMVDDIVSTVTQKYNFCPVFIPEIIEENSKYFIKIEVQEASRFEKPIYDKEKGLLKGGFKRIGGSDIHLTEYDLRRFYQDRMTSPDATPVKGCSINDLDERTVSIYKNRRKLKREGAPETDLDIEDLLQAYNLLSDGIPNIAGLLLFGKESEIKRRFPHFRVDIIRIKGTEWGKDRDPFLSVDLIGNLIYLRAQIVDHLDRFFLTPFKLDQELSRIDVDPFKNALREATTNLLMHQNYFHHSPSQIIIYNDRIEFRNPGYSLKDPEKFNIPGSEIRNSLIAPVFYDLGWAETKGTGIRTQILALKDLGYPEVQWVNSKQDDNFSLIFPYPIEQVTPQATGQATEHVTGQATGQAELDDRLAKVLKFCETPHSLKEIMEFLDLSHREHFMDEILNPLLENKYLRRTVPDKPKSPKQKYVTVKEK